MRVLVCLKQILDPDVPARDFEIDPAAKAAKRGGANLVTNIFCENAIETALQFREAAGDVKVTALCYGESSAEDCLRKAMAMTVDEACLVEREGNTNPDAAAVGQVLAAAISRLEQDGGPFDAVLVGRESGDWGTGQTGGVLAEELGRPALGFVESLSPGNGGITLRRQTDVGIEVAEAEPPFVVTITNNEDNVPRIPKTRDVMMSYRKPLQKVSLADLGLDGDEIRNGFSSFEVEEIFVPTDEVDCELAEGDTLDERVDQLARKIHEVVASIG
ncbi:MAG: electron transfer flavoprotein subunit beta/FixA family protein [Acidobacteria bacterium]|nr:electron transfer flavoprotein subunit beta/FixA family protein [Acidobacteriota bacterium]